MKPAAQSRSGFLQQKYLQYENKSPMCPRFVGRRLAGMITVSTMLLVVAVNTLRQTEAENWGPGAGAGTGARMEWLRGQGARDAARYVRPGQPTALLPPPAGLCAGSPPPQLLLAVPSAVANRERRDAVRATWGRALRDSSRLLFVTGHSGDGRLQEELIAEALVNGDMLVEDMVDTYDNLTVKTLLMLKWTADHCSQVSYVVKVDDDVVLNVRALSRVLAGAAERGWPLVGRLLRRPPPFRSPNHKWYVPRWLYPEDALPEYLSGPSYAVAGSALRPLLRAALKTPLLPLEDVLTTGVAADTAGLTRYDVPGLDAVPSPLWLTRPCLARASLSTGSLTAHEIRAIWDTVSRPPAGLCWLLDRLGIIDHGREW